MISAVMPPVYALRPPVPMLKWNQKTGMGNPSMNTIKLRYFVEVARYGSFSEAARRLYTAQPNLSKQIAQMEQELGFALFTRSRRSVKLTPAGQFLYDQIRDLPDQLDDIFEQARSLARKGEGTLSIGVLEGQDVNQVLSDRLSQIKTIYPQLQITLERNSYQNLRSGLRSGHYDLIITLSFDVEDEADFQLFTLYEKSPAIAMHKTHPLASQKALTLGDLKDENFVVISRQESPGGYQRLVDSCAAEGFAPKIVREPRSLESLLLCVEMGVGISLLDQNTRLELSPYIVTIPQHAPPMAVVAVINRSDQRPVIQNVVKLLSSQNSGEL